jgi:hypothetical protein
MNFSVGHRLVDCLAVATAALCVFGLSGCAGATRLPARTHGPTGANFEAKQLDLHFLDEGGARREEVLQRLSLIDTGYTNPRLFWGRWSDSKWGYWWVVAAQGGAAGDAKRVWHAHNLLVTFDESGVEQKKIVIDDDAALWRELHAQLAELPPLDLTQPVAMAVNRCCWLTEMTLTRDSVHIAQSKKKNPTVEVSPLKIVRISHNGVPNKGSSVGTTCHTLHLAEKSAMGKNIHFCADPPSVALMFQYLRQSAPESLQWE